MRVYVVTKNGVLGMEPVAVFRDLLDADDFCEISDDDYGDTNKATLRVVPLTVDLYVGGHIDEVDSEEEAGNFDLFDRDYEDED